MAVANDWWLSLMLVSSAQKIKWQQWWALNKISCSCVSAKLAESKYSMKTFPTVKSRIYLCTLLAGVHTSHNLGSAKNNWSFLSFIICELLIIAIVSCTQVFSFTDHICTYRELKITQVFRWRQRSTSWRILDWCFICWNVLWWHKW